MTAHPVDLTSRHTVIGAVVIFDLKAFLVEKVTYKIEKAKFRLYLSHTPFTSLYTPCQSLGDKCHNVITKNDKHW